MAGIGFTLRRLYRQDNLVSLIRAYGHSAFASAGPWLFTVLALGLIAAFTAGRLEQEAIFLFRTVLIYNFSFSLVLCGPIFMVATRFLADMLHARDVTRIPGLLVGVLTLTAGASLLAALALYAAFATLPLHVALSAMLNFILISAVWVTSIFISVLRRYAMITRAFLAGMTVATLATCALSEHYGTMGMLNGFSLGLALIFALLLGAALAEYPYALEKPFAFLGYFRRYWEIALSGLFYNLAIWIDKWIMWFAPEAITLDSGFKVYPNYDSAMFVAFLATIPSMALFLFSAETNFFEKYARFFQGIRDKATLARIEADHKRLVESVFTNMRHFAVLQGVIALLGIALAPEIISLLDGNYLQTSMLRYGILGATFHVFLLFLFVLLSYFDSRRLSLAIQTAFLTLNALFTFICLKAGFAYYGYGYFLASFLTFMIAMIATIRYLLQLPYHSFVTSNTSVR